MLAKVTAIQFFPLLLLFFLSLFYFHPTAPAIDIFLQIPIIPTPQQKKNNSTPGWEQLFIQKTTYSQQSTLPTQPKKTKNKQTKKPNNPKQKLLSLVTSSSVTSPVKESVATVAADPLTIFVLPKNTESPILQISKSFKSRTVYRKELARCFEIFSDRRGNETGFAFQFSCSIVSDSLRLHEPQHARPPCPSPTPGVYPNPCPSSR